MLFSWPNVEWTINKVFSKIIVKVSAAENIKEMNNIKTPGTFVLSYITPLKPHTLAMDLIL